MARWRSTMVRWGLTVLAALLLLGWGISSVLLVSDGEYRADGGVAWMMGYGGFGRRSWTVDQAAGPLPSMFLELAQFAVGQNKAWFEWSRVSYAPRSSVTEWFVPAWPLVVIVMAPVVWMWRVRYLERRAAWRRRRGLCGACGYARYGIDVVVACPECGARQVSV